MNIIVIWVSSYLNWIESVWITDVFVGVIEIYTIIN